MTRKHEREIRHRVKQYEIAMVPSLELANSYYPDVLALLEVVDDLRDEVTVLRNGPR